VKKFINQKVGTDYGLSFVNNRRRLAEIRARVIILLRETLQTRSGMQPVFDDINSLREFCNSEAEFAYAVYKYTEASYNVPLLIRDGLFNGTEEQMIERNLMDSIQVEAERKTGNPALN
jgi:hypothetical protein